VDHARAGVQAPRRLFRRSDLVGCGHVHFVDDDDVRHPEHCLAGVIRLGLVRPERIEDRDVERGLEEGEIVVAAVPDDDVSFGSASLRMSP